MAKSIKLGSDTFLSIEGLDGLVADYLSSNANWNDYTGKHKNKIYYVGDSSKMTNAAGSWGFFMVLTWGDVTVQLFFQIGAVFWMRSYTSNGWLASWRKVTLS